MFLDLNNDLYVYKLPDNLTDEQIDWYFKEYLKVDGTWKYVNDVKIHRRLSVSKYKTLFSSAEFYEDIELIRNYFEKYESREAVWIQMKSFACKFLYAKGMIMSDISEIMKYKNHTSIIYFIKSYKNFTNKIKYEDFMIMVKDGIYPKMEGNTINLIEL